VVSRRSSVSSGLVAAESGAAALRSSSWGGQVDMGDSVFLRLVSMDAETEAMWMSSKYGVKWHESGMQFVRDRCELHVEAGFGGPASCGGGDYHADAVELTGSLDDWKTAAVYRHSGSVCGSNLMRFGRHGVAHNTLVSAFHTSGGDRLGGRLVIGGVIELLDSGARVSYNAHGLGNAYEVCGGSQEFEYSVRIAVVHDEYCIDLGGLSDHHHAVLGVVHSPG